MIGLLQAGFLERDLPREAGRVRLQLSDGHWVVGLVAVPALRARPVRLGDLRFHGHDVRGVLVRVRPVDELQHVGDVLLIAILLRLELVLQVELAIAEAKAGLAEGQDVAIGILRIVGDECAEKRAAESVRRAAHQLGQIVLRLRFLHRVEVGLDRLGVELLRGGLVQESAVNRRDLRFLGAGLHRFVRRPFVEQRVHARLGQIGEDGERAVARLVGRDLRRGSPFAVHILEEIVARLDRTIHSFEIDAPRAVVRRGGDGCCVGLRRVGGEGDRGKRQHDHGDRRTQTSQAHQWFPLGCWSPQDGEVARVTKGGAPDIRASLRRGYGC